MSWHRIVLPLETGGTDPKVVEIGNHQTLTKQKGRYYELVKNQLELGE